MEIRKAARKQAKIKLALEGVSGSGKTMSALLLASGIADWSKIAVIDKENHSADLYAHLGEYNVLQLSKPFTPESYIKAIETCEQAKMEVIIIDSVSHEWEGSGGILNIHRAMDGNSFTNWKTHSEYGPAPYDDTWALLPIEADSPFFLSGQSYFEVLWTPPTGNVYYILARSYIAVELNFLNSTNPNDVLAAFNEATSLFQTYTPAEISGLKGKGANNLRKQFTMLAEIFDDEVINGKISFMK